MAITPVTVFTAARMLAIEATAVVGAAVVGDNLVMTRKNGTTFTAGNVRGNPGTMTQTELNNSIQALLETAGTPAALGTASRGVATKAARSDHVHPKDTAAAIGTSSGITLGPSIVNSGEGCEAHRRYNTVTLRIYVQANAGVGTILTMPVGWRPTMPVRFDLNLTTSTNRAALIATNGQVTLEGSFVTGQLAFGYVTYVCSDT